MIRKKTCLQTDCSNPIFSHGYCKYHQRNRPKQTKTTKDRGLFKRDEPSKNNGNFELDKLFYNSIWDSREHKCFNCESQLPSEPLTLYFHHILPKRNYPELRHTDWNIVILCPDCHSSFEMYPNERKHKKIIELTELTKNKL